MEVKKPDLVDIFKDEYHLTEPSLEESTDMMRLRPSVRQKLLQREQDRKLFDEYYSQWKAETMVLSDPDAKFDNPHFRSIVKMGRRAVPFIYEIIRNRIDWISHALEFIYNEGVTTGGTKKIISFEKYCALWCKKIEEKEDMEVVERFAEKLIGSQKDIEPEIQEIVNEHFFEMLDD